MFIIAKTQTGKEFLYNNNTAILCNNSAQAQRLAEFLTANNNDTIGAFKLATGECWHSYEIDEYDKQPLYKIKSTRGKIAITANY